MRKKKTRRLKCPRSQKKKELFRRGKWASGPSADGLRDEHREMIVGVCNTGRERAKEKVGRLGSSKTLSEMCVHEIEVGLASTLCVLSKLPSATGVVVFRQGWGSAKDTPQTERGATDYDWHRMRTEGGRGTATEGEGRRERRK